MPRKKEPDLKLSVETVTPDIAEEWMQYNTRNRRLSERLVGIYAEAMEAGEWRLNGEPIIFDDRGRLQSGQHRLSAVIQAKTAIRTVVVRDAEPEALYSLDSGRKRKLSDALYLRGESDVNNLGTGLAWLWRWKTENMDRMGETATTTHLLKLLDETPEFRDHLEWGRRLRRVFKTSVGLLTALHYIFDQTDSEDCQDFFSKIIEPAGLQPGDPRLILMGWMRRADQLPRRPSQIMVAAVFVKAWNAYREHREIRMLSFRGNEVFPEIL